MIERLLWILLCSAVPVAMASCDSQSWLAGLVLGYVLWDFRKFLAGRHCANTSWLSTKLARTPLVGLSHAGPSVLRTSAVGPHLHQIGAFKQANEII